MHKVIFVLSVLLLSMFFFSAEALTATGTYNDVIWSLNDDGCFTVDGTGDFSYEIPVNYKLKIKTVEIGKGITGIGNYVFSECSELRTLILNEGITTIGSGAFYSCVSLTDITLPSSLSYVGSYAFGSCSTLSTLSFLGSSTVFDPSVFNSCSRIQTIHIVSVEQWLNINSNSIGDSGLAIESHYNLYIGDKLLTDVIIPDTVTQIGLNAFGNCDSITTVSIPEGVSVIRTHAFAYCSNLKTVHLPDSLTEIHNAAFSNCLNLTDI